MAETIGRPYHHGNLRVALLQAAEHRLRTHGVDQLALRDLAREIGVSNAAPRRHFANRQALLDALAEAGFIRLDTALRSALTGTGDDFGSSVHAIASAYTRFATEHAALLELMYTSKHQPDAAGVIAAAEGPFGVMSDVIVRGQQQGALAAGNPEQVGVVLFATLHGLAAMTNGGMLDPELLDGLVDAAVEQLLRGARPVGRDRDPTDGQLTGQPGSGA